MEPSIHLAQCTSRDYNFELDMLYVCTKYIKVFLTASMARLICWLSEFISTFAFLGVNPNDWRHCPVGIRVVLVVPTLVVAGQGDCKPV